MSKAKHYEIHLTRKQAFFTVIALIVCFLLAFSLGTIIGMKYFHDTDTPLLASPIQNETITPSVTNLGTLESHTVSNPEGDKVIHEFTFYNTLPKNADTPIPPKPAEKKKHRQEKPSPTKNSTKNKAITKEGPPEKYTVQFGSFQQKEKAYALSNKLKKQGYLTHVTTTKIENKGTFYRVRMGSFSTQEEAQEWISKLGSYSPPPFITSATD
jgi:septal ring-binding cell division protein DamX